jgi:uridine kinase
VINNLENILKDHDINIITCLNNDKSDQPHNKINEICNNHVIKKVFINDLEDNSYRNSLNYSYKIYNGIKLIENHYDLYIILRTDLILLDLDIINNINNIIDNDSLYLSNKNMNQFTNNIKYKINDNIIITKNYELLSKLSELYEYNKLSQNYLDIVLYNFLHDNNIKYNLIDINYKLILSECNLIAIAGDSGSGKSTLLKALGPLFDNRNLLLLETDRYHKWERGNENYKNYTHLNPYANHLEKMYEDVYNLKIGNDIYQVDYDHDTGKFTSKEEIQSRDNVIICGLHTLYDDKLEDLINIKIYIDTDRELLKKWKIQRDVSERGYSMEKVLSQINAREKDYNDHISIQKEKSDIVINFYENLDNIIQCNFIINNPIFSNKILKDLVELKYVVKIENDKIIIQLNNNNNNYLNNNIINLIFKENENIFKSNYYKEIFYIIYMIII